MNKIPGTEISTALIDFARLAQQSVLCPPSISARKLLERIMAINLAQRGAIFLPSRLSASNQIAASIALPLKSLFRPLALIELEESEAYVLLAQSMLEVENSQEMHLLQGQWLTQRITVTTVPMALQNDGEEQEGEEHMFQVLTPVSAALFLGWTPEALPADTSIASLQERAHAILSQIYEGIGGSLATILLSERNHELQMAADHASLREMELLKAELLGTVSHELRSPLASIKGYAATLLRHEHRISPEERHEFLVAIDNSSDRLTVIVDRLLEMSQLDTGSIQLEYAPVNMIQLVRDALIAAEEQVSHNQQQDAEEKRPVFILQLHIEDGNSQPTTNLPTPVADWRRLREVLDNLLENAVLYSPDGGTISVTLRPILVPDMIRGQNKYKAGRIEDGLATLVPQKMIEVCISDTGIGISQEQVKAIFNRFHRVDTRLTRSANGLGLGLAICKRIIELHNGAIWAESEPGQGSRFYLRLPLDARTSA
jgi:signal transduction histidine kinase